MKTLMEFKRESDRLRDEALKFKTKAAQLKRYDAAREVERKAGELLRSLFTPGQVLTVECSINCTTPAGGGWGLNKGAQVEVMDVYSDLVVVDCGGTVMYLYMLGYNSRGWCSNNLFAFAEYLASKGQTDILIAEAEDSYKASAKSLRGAYRCRHADGLKTSDTFKARLKQQVQWTREAKMRLFKLQMDSLTKQDIEAYCANKAVSRE